MRRRNTLRFSADKEAESARAQMHGREYSAPQVRPINRHHIQLT
jgi:hypothetical protein